ILPFASTGTPTPSDENDPETYPHRIRQTNPQILTLSNGADCQYGANTINIAWIGCRLHHDAMGTTAGGYQYAHDLRGGATGKMLFYGCECVATMSDTQPRQYVGPGNGMTVIWIGTSYYDNRTVNAGGGTNYVVFKYAVGAVVKCYACIFAFL